MEIGGGGGWRQGWMDGEGGGWRQGWMDGGRDGWMEEVTVVVRVGGSRMEEERYRWMRQRRGEGREKHERSVCVFVCVSVCVFV